MVICLQRGADLHMAQLMPLPLTVSCFSKIQIGFTFLVLAHPDSRGLRSVKRVCVVQTGEFRESRVAVPWELLYADDMAVIAETEEELIKRLNDWKDNVESKGMRVNMNKKLRYRRGTARCVVSIEILPIATQQCRNYFHKS